MRKKGSVLIQVLMTAVVVAVIATGMMQLLLLRSTLLKRNQDSAAGRANTVGQMNNQISGCATGADPANCKPDPSCTGSPGNFKCTYTSTNLSP